MKLPQTISFTRRRHGILLVECLVYIGAFAILLAVGTAAFFVCWDHSKALIYSSDDITAALHAGEHWRADVRLATGKISVQTTTNGEVVRIPEAKQEVIYRFEDGGISRDVVGSGNSQLLLPKVKTSQVTVDTRGTVNAWRWELELVQRRKETQQPLLFTFEAVKETP